jgi:hypothetical protein
MMMKDRHGDLVSQFTRPAMAMPGTAAGAKAGWLRGRAARRCSSVAPRKEGITVGLRQDVLGSRSEQRPQERPSSTTR